MGKLGRYRVLEDCSIRNEKGGNSHAPFEVNIKCNELFGRLGLSSGRSQGL